MNGCVLEKCSDHSMWALRSKKLLPHAHVDQNPALSILLSQSTSAEFSGFEAFEFNWNNEGRNISSSTSDWRWKTGPSTTCGAEERWMVTGTIKPVALVLPNRKNVPPVVVSDLLNFTRIAPILPNGPRFAQEVGETRGDLVISRTNLSPCVQTSDLLTGVKQGKHEFVCYFPVR